MCSRSLTARSPARRRRTRRSRAFPAVFKSTLKSQLPVRIAQIQQLCFSCIFLSQLMVSCESSDLFIRSWGLALPNAELLVNKFRLDTVAIIWYFHWKLVNQVNWIITLSKRLYSNKLKLQYFLEFLSGFLGLRRPTPIMYILGTLRLRTTCEYLRWVNQLDSFSLLFAVPKISSNSISEEQILESNFSFSVSRLKIPAV